MMPMKMFRNFVKIFSFSVLLINLLIAHAFSSSSIIGDGTPLSNRIFQSTKKYKDKVDPIFVDGLGREVYFRGWNISGAVKLKSMGFKPFKTPEDAAWALKT